MLYHYKFVSINRSDNHFTGYFREIVAILMCTIYINMATFISKEKFSKTVHGKKEAGKTTPWVDLDKEEIYKIVLIEKKTIPIW